MDETKAMWRCERCESVCEGVAEVVPSPCDYCGSEQIARADDDAPERGPKPPWDDPARWLVGPDEPDVA